jgi:DNA-binding XRE family transcriptional regulator
MSTKSLSKLLAKQLGPISFGGFLRSARTMKNLTQVEMAAFLKISKSSLCDIEKGRQQVSLELASKIAKKCGLSEVVAVEAALKDLVYRSGLKLDVEVKRTA